MMFLPDASRRWTCLTRSPSVARDLRDVFAGVGGVAGVEGDADRGVVDERHQVDRLLAGRHQHRLVQLQRQLQSEIGGVVAERAQIGATVRATSSHCPGGGSTPDCMVTP